jgi:nucleoside-diphosphate-sugar epimerase
MQNFINWYSPTIKSNNAFYPPAGDVKSSDVDVRDVAAVAVKALTNTNNDGRHNGKAYDITGPEAIGIGDWWINGILEVIEWYRKGHGSEVSSDVEEVTGKKPISFSQFVKDYAQAFR